MIHSRKRSLQLIALSPLAIACMAMSAQAANRVDLHRQDIARINSQYATASTAVGVSKQANVRHAEMLGLGAGFGADPAQDAHVEERHQDNTRYEQTFRGVPIYGEQVVVSEDKNGRVHALFGRKVEGLERELPAVAPKVTGAQALATAKRAALGSRLLAMRIQGEKTRQVIFVDDNGRAHMAYVASFFADSAKGGSPTSPKVIVDAASGAVLKQCDALQNAEIGTGPGGNEKTGQYEYGTDFGFLDVEQNGANCTMNSDKVTTINLAHGTTGSTPWTYTCPRNTVEAINGAYAPLNDAHYFGHVVFDMYSDYLQTSPLTGKMTLKVHYSTNYENAFWEPATQTMYFGDGASTFYPLVGLDVLAHEVSHGFTEQNSGLEYERPVGRHQRIVLRHRRRGRPSSSSRAATTSWSAARSSRRRAKRCATSRIRPWTGSRSAAPTTTTTASTCTTRRASTTRRSTCWRIPTGWDTQEGVPGLRAAPTATTGLRTSTSTTLPAASKPPPRTRAGPRPT